MSLTKYKPLFFFLVILFFAAFMRLFALTKVPQSLYWEEVALGYDAYSILKTGKDHHGNSLPIVAFESFGDWKPSGYFYALVPFIKLLGLNELAVRMPSALAGIGSVVLIYLLTKEIILFFPNKFKKQVLPLLAMFLAAISPWGIMFSRAAWEVNLATFFLLFGVYLLFIWRRFLVFGERKRSFISILFAILFLTISMYVYHATRVIAPLLGLLFAIWAIADVHSMQKGNNLGELLKQLIFSAMFAVLLILPILLNLSNTETTHRFSETSVFTDNSEILQSNNFRQIDNNLLSRFESHRFNLYGKKIATNFLSHFNLSFLFLNGDENLRHSTHFFGQLYYLDFVLLLVGSFYLLNKEKKVCFFLFAWIIIAVLPATITLATPHALRTLPTWPALIIVSAFGFYQIIDFLKQIISGRMLMIVSSGIILIYFTQLIAFSMYYFTTYAESSAGEWQTGYKEMLYQVRDLSNKYPNKRIYISRDAGRPAMYYWFYLQVNPTEVQNENQTAKKDQGEFLEFKNVRFANTDISQDAIVASYPNRQWQVISY